MGSSIPILREEDARATEPSRPLDLETMASSALMTNECTKDATGSWNLGKEYIEAGIDVRKRRAMDHVLPHEGPWPAVREGAKPVDMEGRLMFSGAHLPSMLVTLEL